MSGRLLANAALLLAVVTGRTTAAENEARNADQNQKTVEVTVDSAGQSSAKQSSEVKDSAEIRPASGRNPRVLFITVKDCDKCQKELDRLRRPGGEFETMQARGWKIGEGSDNHIQIIDADKIADLVRQLNVREYPTVACISDGEILRSFKDGCSTPLDAWTFGWLLKGKNERPQAAIPEPIRVASTGQYTLRGNHWTIDGDANPGREKLLNHIRTNHGYQLTPDWKIDTWSVEELLSLHDDLHERSDAPFVPSAAQPLPANRGVGQFGAGRKF